MLEEAIDVREGLSGLGVCSFSTLGETDVIDPIFREEQPLMASWGWDVANKECLL